MLGRYLNECSHSLLYLASITTLRCDSISLNDALLMMLIYLQGTLGNSLKGKTIHFIGPKVV